MRELPIIFTGPMVRAILEGRKTQTRRVVTRHNSICDTCRWTDLDLTQPVYVDGGKFKVAGPDGTYHRVWPRLQVGDRQWVRETWRAFDDGDTFYRADYGDVVPVHADDAYDAWRWRPSIFMPKRATRIWLKVDSMHAQWVQEISKVDAEAEGFEREPCLPIDPRDWFASRWDEINAKRGYSWESNPPVWAEGFRVVEHAPQS